MNTSAATRDRFEGCLLGLALGDALGAPYEGGPLERLLWRALGTTDAGEMRWTDDTQMSIDLAESLVACGKVDPDDVARRFAASYRWSRGYGPSAAKVLKRIRAGADWRQASRSVHSGGSFGNGAAMRAPVVALFSAAMPDALVDATRATAIVTHAHPLGVDGAIAIAAATSEALAGRDGDAVLDAAATACSLEPYVARFALARAWLRDQPEPAPRDVARGLGNGIAAADSCVTAVYVAARFLRAPFAAMHAFVVAGRGDVDTIAAMAGAIWGAANGAAALPAEPLARLEQRERIRALAGSLHEAGLRR
jgi:poly(ADP-ribose) glycohydrolase ARH3